ncbi:MAG TPA: hypothetical protein VN894_01985 [Polyangiaceae bacterium]|nr:hypothetical protein [Polyangiaceae bacterium]
MKFCVPHWEKLRANIKERGLFDLVAKSGEEIHGRMVAELESGPTKTTFDPLMGAHNMIVRRVLDTVGLDLMLSNEDGSEKCPICYIAAGHAAQCKDPTCKVDAAWYERWLGLAADDALTEAKRLGLVGES